MMVMKLAGVDLVDGVRQGRFRDSFKGRGKSWILQVSRILGNDSSVAV